MVVAVRLLLVCLTLAGVLTAQLFGLQRGYFAQFNGETVWTLASHHHLGEVSSAVQLADYLPGCRTPNATDAVPACDPSDARFHTSLQLDLKMQAGGGVAPLSPPPAICWEIPVLSVRAVKTAPRFVPVSAVPPGALDLSAATLVTTSMVLLV